MQTYLVTFLRWPNSTTSIYQSTTQAESLRDAIRKEGIAAQLRNGWKLVPVRVDVLNSDGCWENAWDSGL